MKAQWDSMVLPVAVPAPVHARVGAPSPIGAAVGLATATPAMSTSLEKHLVLLREQEKLARDVYSALHAKWGVPVFKDTAAAEGLHMASVKLLLDWYRIDDPVGSNPPGLFINEELQTAYAALVTRGAASLGEAYEVGVIVEKLLIVLLKGLVGDSRPRDVSLVAQTLLASAQNHLANFVSFGDWLQGKRAS